MSNQAAVMEKYGALARAVTEAGAAGRGAAACSDPATRCCDPITKDLYGGGQMAFVRAKKPCCAPGCC